MEALKSEKEEKDRTGNKLSLELQKRVLLHIQFRKCVLQIANGYICIFMVTKPLFSVETLRLDALVDDTYKYFVNRYIPGELVQCTWDDNIA